MALALPCLGHAAGVSISGGGLIGVSNASGTNEQAIAPVITDVPGGKSLSFSASNYDVFPASVGIGSADVYGMGLATPGLLRAMVSSSASHATNPTNPSLPGFYGTRGASSVSVGFTDVIHVESDTLPVGTLVQFEGTLSMDFLSSGPGGYGTQFVFNWQVGSYDLGLYLPNGLYTTVPTNWDVWRNVPITFTGAVGYDVAVSMTMSLSVDTPAGYYPSWYGAGEQYLGDVRSAFIDASHTAQMFLAPITPGVSLVAESGHDYTLSPVPEPAAWVLTLAGFGTLLAARRRRAPLAGTTLSMAC